MKAPARTVALIARSERRLTERTGIASFQGSRDHLRRARAAQGRAAGGLISRR
ncbi:MAG: hypothetical protein ACJ740_18450 [Gaiellales bacterium]|jgi:hypothetical protein